MTKEEYKEKLKNINKIKQGLSDAYLNSNVKLKTGSIIKLKNNLYCIRNYYISHCNIVISLNKIIYNRIKNMYFITAFDVNCNLFDIKDNITNVTNEYEIDYLNRTIIKK